MPPSPTQSATKEEIMDRVGAMAPRFAERAAAAEEARRIPPEFGERDARRRLRPHPGAEARRRLRARLRHLVRGHARTEQGRCLARLVRQPDHPPQSSDRAVSAKPRSRRCGPTVSTCRLRRRSRRRRSAVPVDGGYRVSGKGSPFASGVDHCTWVMLGGMAQDDDEPEWKFFLVAARRLHACATPGSPPACAAPAARPSSPTTRSCRASGC